MQRSRSAWRRRGEEGELRERGENAPCVGEDEGRMDLLLVPSVPGCTAGTLEKKTLTAA